MDEVEWNGFFSTSFFSEIHLLFPSPSLSISREIFSSLLRNRVASFSFRFSCDLIFSLSLASRSSSLFSQSVSFLPSSIHSLPYFFFSFSLSPLTLLRNLSRLLWRSSSLSLFLSQPNLLSPYILSLNSHLPSTLTTGVPSFLSLQIYLSLSLFIPFFCAITVTLAYLSPLYQSFSFLLPTFLQPHISSF